MWYISMLNINKLEIMRNKKYSYYLQVIFVISLFLTALSSCQFDELAEDCEEKGLIILNLGVDGMSTRAAGDQLFAGDEAITKVRIFVFVGDALEVNRLYSIGESQFNNPFVLEVATGLKDIYVVANESGTLETSLASVSSKSGLLDLMADEISSPLSIPLLMTGSIEEIEVVENPTSEQNNPEITLTRAAAKISMQFNKAEGLTDNIKITKVSLLSNAYSSTLFPAATEPTDPTFDTDTYWDLAMSFSTPIDVTTSTPEVADLKNIYLYENLGNSAGNKAVATQLEIEALYNNIETKYRVYINEDIVNPTVVTPGNPNSSVVDIKDHYYNIKRNYHYELTGTISGLGEYTTISVKVKILPWTVHEYAVPLE